MTTKNRLYIKRKKSKHYCSEMDGDHKQAFLAAAHRKVSKRHKKLVSRRSWREDFYMRNLQASIEQKESEHEQK